MAANPAPHDPTTPPFPRPLPPVLASNRADRVTAAASTFLPHSPHLLAKSGAKSCSTTPRCRHGQRPCFPQIRLDLPRLRLAELIFGTPKPLSPFFPHLAELAAPLARPPHEQRAPLPGALPAARRQRLQPHWAVPLPPADSPPRGASQPRPLLLPDARSRRRLRLLSTPPSPASAAAPPPGLAPCAAISSCCPVRRPSAAPVAPPPCSPRPPQPRAPSPCSRATASAAVGRRHWRTPPTSPTAPFSAAGEHHAALPVLPLFLVAVVVCPSAQLLFPVAGLSPSSPWSYCALPLVVAALFDPICRRRCTVVPADEPSSPSPRSSAAGEPRVPIGDALFFPSRPPCRVAVTFPGADQSSPSLSFSPAPADELQHQPLLLFPPAPSVALPTLLYCRRRHLRLHLHPEPVCLSTSLVHRCHPSSSTTSRSIAVIATLLINRRRRLVFFPCCRLWPTVPDAVLLSNVIFGVTVLCRLVPSSAKCHGRASLRAATTEVGRVSPACGPPPVFPSSATDVWILSITSEPINYDLIRSRP
ncbi:hypothetical protein E2562_002165 [Oryza meyeriana var. granulata]|uniref:Uncharacterized protein n=1 Tax=Oryza meyeriana var. granulata TaxID=110450 RepID=A0A6G1EDR4_9ORYZ|nr:hypothetical protein E2562_002165 [Oryza meyeriana var. granulata]